LYECELNVGFFPSEVCQFGSRLAFCVYRRNDGKGTNLAQNPSQGAHIQKSKGGKEFIGMKQWRTILAAVLTLALLLAAAPPALAQTDAQECGDTYTVQPGDYLFRIAQDCDVPLPALIAANPQIVNPNIIFPGQVINIPDMTAPTIPVTGGSVYLVVPGDTLWGIATRFNVTLNQLLAANPNLTRTSIIYPGNQITLPQGAAMVPTVRVNPTIAAVGQPVTLVATGFQANTNVVIAFGPSATEVTQAATGTTDANGALSRTLEVPEGAAAGQRYVFVVHLADDTTVRAASNPITIQAAPGVPVTGDPVYVVQPGDNLFRIGLRFGTTVQQLLTLNPWIANPNLIFPGQNIQLPGGGS
jgi:LysM repeat protein